MAEMRRPSVIIDRCGVVSSRIQQWGLTCLQTKAVAQALAMESEDLGLAALDEVQLLLASRSLDCPGGGMIGLSMSLRLHPLLPP